MGSGRQMFIDHVCAEMRNAEELPFRNQNQVARTVILPMVEASIPGFAGSVRPQKASLPERMHSSDTIAWPESVKWAAGS